MPARRCLQTDTPCTCGIRALVVDNDPVYRSIHSGYLRDWGFTVHTVEGHGEALARAALERADKERIQIALVDMRLTDDEDRSDTSGLLLAKDLKERAGLRTIIVTGYGTMEAARTALRVSDAFDIIGKEEGPRRLEQVVRAAAHVFCRNALTIHWPVRWSAQRVAAELGREHDTVAEDEALDVISLLFPDAQTLTLEWLDGAVATDAQSSLHRRSIVFLAHEGLKQPVILKLMRAGKARMESENYELVASYLGGPRRANLVDRAEWWHLSGITYELLGRSSADAQRPLQTFSRFYRDERTATRINSVLQPYFSEVWGRLLDPGQASDRGCGRAVTGSLFANYIAGREGEAYGHQVLARWTTEAGTLSFSVSAAHQPSDVAVPGCLNWLSQNHSQVLPNAQQAYVHGDLHGDNLLVDEKDTVWSIDFGRTRCAHVLTDFGQLTQFILTRLAQLPDGDHTLLYHLAVALCAPSRGVDEPLRMTSTIAGSGEATKAFHVIGEVRAIAARVTHYTDLREFLWSVLLDCATVAELLPPDAPRRQKLMLLGGVICRRLENRQSTWPPQEWPPVTWQDNGADPGVSLVLFVASNVENANRLMLEEEMRRVGELLQKSEFRTRFAMEKEFPEDAVQLSEYLDRHRPQIVHFGGHGSQAGGIRLHGRNGIPVSVPETALRDLFRFYAAHVRCVVLNACYSQSQAEAIAEQIEAVIGMASSIRDEAAIKFAEGFYQKLFAGWSVKDSFDHGCAIIDASRMFEQDKPRLICPHSDSAQIRFT